MCNFFELYNSFDEFFDTFFRGNEIEFLYQNKRFYILPIYNEDKSVMGVSIGIAYGKTELICLSKNELYNAWIDKSIFGNILQEIEIVWNNF